MASEWLQLDKHDQAQPSHIDDHGLVVPDPRIGLPAPGPGQGLLDGKAALERGLALGLPAHEHRLVEEQGRSALFDDLDTFGLEVGPARWRQAELSAGWEHHPAPGAGTPV